MEEQSGREFASTDPMAGAQDATFQERSLCAEIPLNACRRVQHFQRPTPSHVSSITPRATHCGDEYVARGRRGRLKIRMARSPRLFTSQRDDAPDSRCRTERPKSSRPCHRDASATLAEGAEG